MESHSCLKWLNGISIGPFNIIRCYFIILRCTFVIIRSAFIIIPYLILEFTIFLEITNMSKLSRAKRQEVFLRVHPDSPERIFISTNENEPEKTVRNRRRTTSFRGRRPTEKRRASLPAFYKMSVKPETTKKSLIKKIGSRLAKLGDELVKRNSVHKASKNSEMASKVVKNGCQAESEPLKHYARQLAYVGDYLNALYATECSPAHSESYYTALAGDCLVLATILIGLKNNNVVVINTSDLNALSSICRVHRSKSLSRTRK